MSRSVIVFSRRWREYATIPRSARVVLREARTSTRTWEVAHPAATHQHDRVLLQVVPDARDVGRDLDLAGEPDPGDLAEGGVRLLGRGRVDARADPAALRAALERRGRCLGYLVLAALADQLLDRGHRVSVFYLLLPVSVRPGGRLTCSFFLFSDPRGRAWRPH